MNSEKVKEIKECFEVLNEYGETYITKDQTQRKFVKYADVLTYINELESENAELKQDLKKSIGTQKELLDGFNTVIKEVEQNLKREIPNLIKQFAERVKMEFYYEFDEIIPSIMSDKIDKILKEILGE